MERPERTRSFYDFDFSRYHRKRYGNDPYGDYEFAYQYGYELANNPGYQGRLWEDVEGAVVQQWSARYPDYSWEHYGDAVREGWRNVAGTLR